MEMHKNQAVFSINTDEQTRFLEKNPNLTVREYGCIHQVYELFVGNGYAGEIYNVSGLVIAKDGAETSFVQNFYIPPNADDDDLALNSWENGYLSCPRLTVKEVRAYGRSINPREVKYS